MNMTTRKLNFGDAFKLAAIIKKTGLRSEIAQLAATAGKSNDIQKLGAQVLLTILEGAPAAQTEICELIGSLTGKSKDDVLNCSISEIVDICKKIADENDLASFFTSALK